MDITGRTSRLSEQDADALLTGRAVPGHDDLHATLGLLRASVAAPAPSPSTVLAVMLAEGLPPMAAEALPAPAAWRRWAVRAAVAAATAVTATFGAATANALPAPLQSAVADVVDAFTPFDLPRPAAGSPQAPPSGDPRDVAPPAGGTDPAAPADGRAAEEDGSDRSTTVVPDPQQPERDDDREAERPEGAEPDPGGPDDDPTDNPGDDSGDAQPDTEEPDTEEPDVEAPQAEERDGDVPAPADVDDPAADAPGSDRIETDPAGSDLARSDPAESDDRIEIDPVESDQADSE